MKKIFVILLSLFICFSLCGCQQEEHEEQQITQYETLDEINKLASVHLIATDNPSVTDERYYMRDNDVAEYIYYIDGYLYYMRGTKHLDIDVSGVFKNGKTLFNNLLEEKIAYDESNGYKVYRFLVGEKQYIFGVNDNEKIDKETLEAKFYEIYKQVIFDSTINDIRMFVGEYQDITSQRATMNYSLVDANTPVIYIVWSSSNELLDEWIIQCSYDGYKLIYETENVQHIQTTYDENGEAKPKYLDDTEAGYFEFIDGNICWTGSQNEQTSNCVFQKIN